MLDKCQLEIAADARQVRLQLIWDQYHAAGSTPEMRRLLRAAWQELYRSSTKATPEELLKDALRDPYINARLKVWEWEQQRMRRGVDERR